MAFVHLVTKRMMQLPKCIVLLFICIICRSGSTHAWQPWIPNYYASSPSSEVEVASSPGAWSPSSDPEAWAPSSPDPEAWSPSGDSAWAQSPTGPELLAPWSDANSAMAPYSVSQWTRAHATFYGGDDASGTMGGACGYGNLYSTGYNTATAALSSVLFNGGQTCGACFEIMCDMTSKQFSTKWCYPNAGSVIVTGTNLCPANWARTTNGWCNPPQTHFDMAYPTFAKLAQKVAGIIPVQYRRVQCVKQGGLKFQISGNNWFNLVLVFNVGGVGSVTEMSIMGSESSSWIAMTRNWGQQWDDKNMLVGQSLSFKVTAEGGHCLYITKLTDPDWQHGATYTSSYNF